MASQAPSSSRSSPELHRERKAPRRRYGSMADLMRHPCLVSRQDPRPLRFGSMADVMRRSRPIHDAPPPAPLVVAPAREAIVVYDDDVVCGTCGSGDHGDQLLLCDRCDRGRHTFCLRPIIAKVPNGPWFCPDCAPPVKPIESFPVEQSKIIDFFRIQNYDQDGKPTKNVRSQRKRTLLMNKKRRILPYVPSEDITTRLGQMASLATALTSSKSEFSNELTYMPNMAPRSSNQARLEKGGIQVLNKKDKETIELCRTMQQRGQCPPLLVADAKIKDMTFIAEFAGDVDYLEIRENDDCNCMMTLLLTADPSQSLVICQDKRANISRFISGINNHTPDGKKKQNVKCVWYEIDGESHVLLVVCRDIAHGEKLYCDYNGYEDVLTISTLVSLQVHQIPGNQFKAHRRRHASRQYKLTCPGSSEYGAI